MSPTHRQNGRACLAGDSRASGRRLDGALQPLLGSYFWGKQSRALGGVELAIRHENQIGPFNHLEGCWRSRDLWKWDLTWFVVFRTRSRWGTAGFPCAPKVKLFCTPLLSRWRVCTAGHAMYGVRVPSVNAEPILEWLYLEMWSPL